MINAYYLMQAGAETGPFTLYELQDFNLEPDTLVLSPLAADWQEAGDLPELAEYFESRGIYAGHSTYAGFWWRLLAHIIDAVLLEIVITAITTFMETASNYVNNYFSDLGTYLSLFSSLGTFFLFILYDAVCEASEMQGSIGKKICKIIVVDYTGRRISFSKALARNFGKILSSLICGLGYLAVLWDNQSQAWHDQLAKTYVIKKN